LRVYRYLIIYLIVLMTSLASIPLPVSAEIKGDLPLQITPNSNVNIKPIITELIPLQNSSEVQVKWKTPVLAAGFFGTPAIGPDNSIYLGSNTPWILSIVKRLSKYNSNGEELWTFSPKNVIVTSPTVGPDGTVYVGTGNVNAAGELVAVRPDGTLKWVYTAGGKITSAPVFGTDGTLYVASPDGILHALDPQDGSEIWWLDMEVKSQANLAMGPNDMIYATMGTNSLYAIRPVGTKKWEFSTNGVVSTTPAVGPDGTIYIGSADHKLYAILPSGEKKWDYNQGNSVFTPAVGQDGSVYFGSEDNNLTALSPNGKLNWIFAAGGSKNPPVIGPNGLIYTQAVNSKVIYALDRDGRIQWHYKIATEEIVPFAVDYDGTLYDVSTVFPKNVDQNDLRNTMVMYMYAIKVPVTSITLNQTSLTLAEGQSSSLTAKIAPSHASNPNVIWKSSNPNIASVDTKGNVSAKLSGTVIITASSSDGPSAQMKVTVTDKVDTTMAVTNVGLNKTSLSLQIGDKETLLATVTPDNASNQKVTWASSNPGVASVSTTGRVTAHSTGSTDVTVKTEDGNLTAKSKVVVTAKTADPTASEPPFHDIEGHWARSEIIRAYDLKVTNGYPDFTFRPNANITRSEFTVMLMNGLKPAIEGTTLTFKDKNSIENWATKSVEQAVQLGIISGYPDGTFRPTANITHAEMISMVVKALGITLPAEATTNYSDDAIIPKWAKPFAAFSGKNNLLGGTMDNKFAPSALATRAEAIVAIVRMLDLKP